MIACVVTGTDASWVPPDLGATVTEVLLDGLPALLVEVEDAHARTIYRAARALGGRYCDCRPVEEVVRDRWRGVRPDHVLVPRSVAEAAADRLRRIPGRPDEGELAAALDRATGRSS